MDPIDFIVANNSQLLSLDLTSHKLSPDDAYKCLTGVYHVIVPTPRAKVCNNLDEYLYKSTANARKTPNKNSEANSELHTRGFRYPSTLQEPFAVPLVRNFERILKKTRSHGFIKQGGDPEQESSQPKRARPDVFSRVEMIEPNSGPLSHLKSRIGQVVKVIIRRRRKVPYRSRVIEYKGRLTLFDKHMNLFLEDVIESFTYETGGKAVKRARSRSGILLRGDNVILVA